MPSLASPPLTTSFSSTTSTFNTSEGKRNYRLKDFQYKYGHKHHSYDHEKAPYPLSYDRNALDIESLDNRFVHHVRDSVFFMQLRDSPVRILDLGCGTGIWAIDAAKEYPSCEVVGFDLVDIQIPLKHLDPPLAHRIEWRHGNFLTSKLPFDDDEFDHVHIQSIAKGVPENKWGVLFEEINRVLKPGGSVEVIEDDAIFPCLPRWFTTALRSRPLRTKSMLNSEPPRTASSVAPSTPNAPRHDHALLESLYNSVFEHRFIHMKPSAVLPSYLTTYFRQVTVGPVLSFPMPPLAPLLPLPPQIATSYIVEPLSDLLDHRNSITHSPPNTRPASLSFSSSISSANSTLASLQPLLPLRTRTSSAPYVYNAETSFSSFDPSLAPPVPLIDVTTLPLKRFMLDNSPSENGNYEQPQAMFPLKKLSELSERSLAMHLYRSFQCVLACQEAMWEELKDRIRNRKEELLPFGWDDDEELEELQSRKKFEKLVERYQSDIHARVSFWCSLDDFGWPLPTREPLTKAELIEEERIRDNMIEARKYATVEEMQVPCRSLRVILGYKL